MTVTSQLSVNTEKQNITRWQQRVGNFLKKITKSRVQVFLFHTASQRFSVLFGYYKIPLLLKASSSELSYLSLTNLSSYFAHLHSLYSIWPSFVIYLCLSLVHSINYFPLANNELSMCLQKQQCTLICSTPRTFFLQNRYNLKVKNTNTD